MRVLIVTLAVLAGFAAGSSAALAAAGTPGITGAPPQSLTAGLSPAAQSPSTRADVVLPLVQRFAPADKDS